MRAPLSYQKVECEAGNLAAENAIDLVNLFLKRKLNR